MIMAFEYPVIFFDFYPSNFFPCPANSKFPGFNPVLFFHKSLQLNFSKHSGGNENICLTSKWFGWVNSDLGSPAVYASLHIFNIFEKCCRSGLHIMELLGKAACIPQI